MEVYSILETTLIEIIPIIAQHLSVKELGACCAASKRMRELFQSDDVWRPRCVKCLAEYLSHTPCKVEPGFVSPEHDNSSLSPIPDWRMAFMRENHLTNNWKLGRYVEEKVHISKRPKYCIDRPRSLFYSNDVVITASGNGLEIIDVSKDPAELAMQPVIFGVYLRRDLELLFHNDMVIVSELSVVLLYKIDLNKKTCLLQNLFLNNDCLSPDSSYVSKVQAVREERLSRLPRLSVIGDPIGCVVTETVTYELSNDWIVDGVYFLKIESGTRLHVWNYETGLKVADEPCPFKIYIVLSSNSTIVVFGVKYKEESTFTFLAYSLTSLTYLPFKVTLPCNRECYMLNACVCICNNDDCFIYNCKTSELLLKCEFFNSNLHNDKSFSADLKPAARIMNDCFLFVGNDLFLKSFHSVNKTLTLLPVDNVIGFKIPSGTCLMVASKDRPESWWKFDGSSTFAYQITVCFDSKYYYRFNKAGTRCFKHSRLNEFIMVNAPYIVIHYW